MSLVVILNTIKTCHRCGRRVRLEHRVCRHRGCEFEPIRFGR